jgi:hypothetical protein
MQRRSLAPRSLKRIEARGQLSDLRSFVVVCGAQIFVGGFEFLQRLNDLPGIRAVHREVAVGIF